MTNNTTTTAAADRAELMFVDPATLVIDDNIRTDALATIDKAFVASVATGLLQPVSATRDEDGTLRVRDGQRRTLAARQAGLAEISVFIVAATSSDQNGHIDRIRDQWVANEHRTALTSGQKAAAFQELLDLGLSATKIAKTTHTSKKVVDAALAASTSEVARTALDTSALTLEQGALVAAYDTDGDSAAVNALLAAANTGQFDHKAAELAATAEQRRIRRDRTAELAAQGYTTLDDKPNRRSEALVPLGVLYRLDTGEYLREADMRELTAEHLAVWVDADCETRYLDADGVEPSPNKVDWSVSDEPADVPAAEGMIDPRTLTEHEVWEAEESWYHCNPAADHLGTWSQYLDHKSSARAAVSVAGEDTDPETAAQAQAEADAAHKAAQSAARKRLLALNKLAVAAQTVRRDALKAALARKTLPKGKAVAVATFQAITTWKNADLYNLARRNADAKTIAAELLGGTDPMTALDGASGERTQVIALAITLAAHEANVPKESWQGGHQYLRSIGEGRTRYLRFLVEVYGYDLADIEKVVTGDLTADDIALT